MSTNRFVEIGGQARPVPPFSTAKIGQMFRVAASLGSEWAAIQHATAEYRQQYAATHKVTTTRDEVAERLEVARDMVGAATSDAARAEWESVAAGWQRRLDGPLKDKDAIELPLEATWQEIAGHVIPSAFEDAEPLIKSLLGLLVISNDELFEADKADRRDQAIRELGLEVYYQSTPDEALELLNVGFEMFLGDTEARRENLGKLRDRFLKAMGMEADTMTTETTGSEGMSGTGSKTGQSTDSPARTTGPRKSSSTGSRTAKSVA